MSDVLDRCRAHLDLVGFGPREMATLDINDSGEIAKQIAFELNITPGQELEDAIVEWIQEACETAFWASYNTQEPAPPPGDRIKKLEISGNELLAREEKLLDMWAKRLEGSLDPSRAAEMIAGRTRASSALKRYVVVYQRWRLCNGYRRPSYCRRLADR